ncbi:hypothetical protein [Xylophilus sp.]|uniref:hypothetical protein n=1 Tax=Xylophilus sp. TaxID=2653893 RepID=UPI0013BD3E5F|nr:hypothetical protein [Xylophilus sp.]KAF1047052.1 MAG: hypothetical protein GAK38_02096 [Xylophilus sp.]
MLLETLLLLAALAAALALQPWRMLRGGALGGPLLATLVLLPWLWALPALHAMPLQLQWSGACLVLLMLGWPLAVPVFAAVAALAWAFAPSMAAGDALGLAGWQGIAPATLALGLGWLVRRFVGAHLFVYVLGRAFLGTVVCVFIAGALSQFAGHALPRIDGGLSLVGRWLMAWGDGIVTGMLVAVFVAFRPAWLATWSDRLYLPPPG